MEDKDITPVQIEDEMKESYIDYAMSVIVSRALPDIRDGLKPVHRRILYAMHELGLSSGKSFKKSARIVGETMGKYHPHGDQAIYDTLVRLAQDFSLRYPLVDGQGNFGSIDGDSAAAMRYTESRLQRVAEEMLLDIDKETVNWRPNFDDSLNEPTVLPARLPMLLVNGSDGIAVGMATKIPPHNICETVDALLHLIDEPQATVDDLMQIIKGPDFPTGGLIVSSSELKQAYKTGRGRIIVRGKTITETASNGRSRIIITEIPYQVNKTKLIEDIANLVRDKRVEGISDIRDESDRKGMRIVLDLKKGESDELITNQIIKYTPLQVTFGVNMVALVNRRPMVVNLKRLCQEFLLHRQEVITRRTRYELRKAEERVHILEGLKIAVDNIDEVIALIRQSKDTETARAQLITRFDLSEIQARAILEMRLQRLTGLEIEKLVKELEALYVRVSELQAILADVRKVYEIVKEDLIEIKEKFGDGRRTQFIQDVGDMNARDLLEDEVKVITLTTGGYIKSLPLDTYRKQGRGGKGMKGISLKEEDLVERVFVASTFDFMLFFTNRGRCFAIEVYKIPEGSRIFKGKALVNLLSLTKDETVSAILPIKSFEQGGHIVMVTRKGRVKRSELVAYKSAQRQSGIIGFKFADKEEDDEIINVRFAKPGNTVVMGTRNGKAIRFKVENARVMGRNTQGVKGITLARGDAVVGMEVIREKATLLVVTENGYGKRTDIGEYRIQSRGGSGIINIKVNPRNGPVAGFREVLDDDDIIVSSATGKVIRIRASNVSKIGRNTQGVRIIDCSEGDHVVGVTVIHSDEEETSDGTNGVNPGVEGEETTEIVEAPAEEAPPAGDDVPPTDKAN